MYEWKKRGIHFRGYFANESVPEDSEIHTLVCVFDIPVCLYGEWILFSPFLGLIDRPQTVTLFSSSKIILTTFTFHLLSFVVIGILLGGL